MPATLRSRILIEEIEDASRTQRRQRITHMHKITEDLNTQIPFLTRSNYHFWDANTMVSAEEHEISDMFTIPAPAELVGAVQKHAKRRSQAYLLVLSTLTQDTLARIDHEPPIQEPRQMLFMIKEAYAVDETPKAHETLRLLAKAILIKPRESLEDYFDRHMRLRVEVTQTRIYPLIENEVTPVKLILNGLSARPVYKPNITMLRLQRMNSIQETRSAVQVLKKALGTYVLRRLAQAYRKERHDNLDIHNSDTIFTNFWHTHYGTVKPSINGGYFVDTTSIIWQIRLYHGSYGC